MHGTGRVKKCHRLGSKVMVMTINLPYQIKWNINQSIWEGVKNLYHKKSGAILEKCFMWR